MELQGHKISNLGKFRKYFRLEEAAENLDIFIKDFRDIFYEEEKDWERYEFIRWCANGKKPAGLSLAKEAAGDGPELTGETRLHLQVVGGTESDSGQGGARRLLLEFQDEESMGRILNSSLAADSPWLAAELIAVCELAGVPCPVDYFIREEALGKGDKGPGFDFDHTVREVEFTLWDPGQDRSQNIVTRKLTRETYTQYSAGAELVVRDRQGGKVTRAGKRLIHELYGNFIGDCLVELLPEESTCEDFRVYKSWQEDGGIVLKREKGKQELPPYQGDTEAFGRMSCFAATEDGGILGIKEGKVIACTSLVKPSRLWGEKAVYVCEAKGLYAVLTEKGRLVTNFAFQGERVCMFRMDRQGNVYALQRDGRVVSSNEKLCGELRGYQEIVQLWHDPEPGRLILRDRRGKEFTVYIPGQDGF